MAVAASPDLEPPPPYSPPTALVDSAAPPSAAPSSAAPSSSYFSNHLAGLRGRMHAEQDARLSARDRTDDRTLALVVPHVERLLASVAAIDPAPTLVEATVVPDLALAHDWRPSEDERRAGETRVLLRVSRPSKGAVKAASGGGEGDDELWWADEDLARRLAAHLQPEPRPRPPRPTTTGAPATHRSSRWPLFGRPKLPPPPPPPPTSGDAVDDVAMTVAAEEVTFRRENAMGLWETRTGWGLVVRLRIRPRG
ncbi:hypothetical protein RJ55_03431 [Drechmeria coniospora]|nr:hypothetical protein RJ55_03431 [Drechmeria coniospora]